MTTLKRWNGTDYEYIGLPTNVGMSPQTIGYAEVLTNQGSIVNTNVDLAGYSVTITVPEGRRIRVSSRTYWTTTTSTDEVYVALYEGGTQLSEERKGPIGAASVVEFSTILSPTAGTHTYKLVARRFNGSGGTLTNNAWSGGPGFLLVEDITGSTLPYRPASVPVGLIAQAERASDFTGIPNTNTAITGLTANIVVPAGRTLKVTFSGDAWYGASAAAIVVWGIWQDGVRVAECEASVPISPGDYAVTPCIAIVSPSAGAHTYQVYARHTTGTINLGANNAPARLTIEDITPTPAPANTAPSSTLAYAEVVSDQGGITGEVDLTNLAVTVTVPAGRRLKITGRGTFSSTAVDEATGYIKEGSTYLGRFAKVAMPVVGNVYSDSQSTVVSPSAGTHTYKLTALRSGTGTATFHAEPQGAQIRGPAFILVEDITGVGVSGHTHTEFDDTGWISLVPYLVNGWVSYDNNYGPPRFRRKAGVVWVQGLIRSGSLGSVIATLPPGFRPSIPVLLLPNNEHNGGTAGRLDVYADGRIVHAGGSFNDYVAVTLSYPADQ